MKILCSVCKSNKIIFKINYNSNSKLFFNTKIYNCKICSSSFAYPVPAQDNLKRYYETQSETSIGQENAGLLNKSFAYMLAKTRARFIENNTNLKKIKSLKILEVGPGYGHLAEIIMKSFSITDYSVVEYDKKCFKKLKKIGTNVFDDINKIKKNNKYNLIIISHVLEHIADPISFLLKLKNNFLKGNSFIFIDVPCEDWKYKTYVDPHLIFLNKYSFIYINNIIKTDLIKISYFGENINTINDNETNFYLRQYKKIILIFQILLNIFKKDKGNYNSIQYSLKTIFKADEESNSKSRWIRLVLKNGYN